jgi:aminopeptidase N
LIEQKQSQGDAGKHKPFVLPSASVHYARDRAVDVQHVKLELSVNHEKRILNGSVQVEFVPLASNVTRLEFDAVDLDIMSVKLSGQPVDFENTGQKVIVRLNKALKSSESASVTIEYSGRPRRGLYFVGPDKAYPNRPYQAWTQGEDSDSRYWFPCYDYPNDRATSEMIIAVPQKYTAISNGILLETKEEKAKGTRTFHWKQDIPHSSYLTSLVVGEYSIIREKVEDVELSYYVPKGREEDAKRSFAKTPEMIRYFGEYFGVKYPYPKYAQVVVSDFIFGGMENISATTLTENTLHDKRAHLDFTSDDLVSHELAHQWWGDLITCRDWSHAWLNEGFATYCETLFKEHDLGKDETVAYQMQDLEQYLEEDRDRYRPAQLLARSILTHQNYSTAISTRKGV